MEALFQSGSWNRKHTHTERAAENSPCIAKQKDEEEINVYFCKLPFWVCLYYVTKQKNSGAYDMEEIILSVQFLKIKLSLPYDSEFFCLNQMVDKECLNTKI